MLTHVEFPCHCLLQTWWYLGRSNLVLIWDCGELLSIGLPDSSQPIMIVIVGVMLGIRWLEAHGEGEQSTCNAYEKTIARVGLSERFRSFRDNMQNLKPSDENEEDMGQTMTDAMG